MKVAGDVVRAIDAERVAMTTLLSALVAIPTENPPATGYAPCVALLESALDERGLPFEIERMIECAKIYALTAIAMLGAG